MQKKKQSADNVKNMRARVFCDKNKDQSVNAWVLYAAYISCFSSIYPARADKTRDICASHRCRSGSSRGGLYLTPHESAKSYRLVYG